MKLQCGSKELDLSSTQVMGIVNMTPDSFSDGGQFNNLDAALHQVQGFVEAGASIIDVGGESTRPGAKEVGLEEELKRTIPLIKAIAERFDVVISIDSSNAEVMKQAVKAGAGILNDVRSFTRDGALDVAIKSGLPLCVMHMQGSPQNMQDNPQYDDIVEHILGYLQNQVTRLMEGGVSKSNIIVDPGFGFGKTLEHNLSLLKEFNRFNQITGLSLAGLSRKNMIGQITGKTVDQRQGGSVGGAVIAAINGASIVRVHDVHATVDAIKMVNALK